MQRTTAVLLIEALSDIERTLLLYKGNLLWIWKDDLIVIDPREELKGVDHAHSFVQQAVVGRALYGDSGVDSVYWRGRYEKRKNIVTIIPPGDLLFSEIRQPPRFILRVLRRKWPGVTIIDQDGEQV